MNEESWEKVSMDHKNFIAQIFSIRLKMANMKLCVSIGNVADSGIPSTLS